ncbi:MAG: hypothetical protein Q8R78_02910 [Candidatus Omnitrophota bacterium]|nr:hypothetical protein [Candidatus Omnitrophota bacterium]
MVPIVGYHRVGRANGDHVPTVSAEALFDHLPRHGLRKRHNEESPSSQQEVSGKAPSTQNHNAVDTKP